jgi:hypothetical protein
LFPGSCSRRCLVAACLLLFSISPRSLRLLGVDHVPVYERQPISRETGFRLRV